MFIIMDNSVIVFDPASQLGLTSYILNISATWSRWMLPHPVLSFSCIGQSGDSALVCVWAHNLKYSADFVEVPT